MMDSSQMQTSKCESLDGIRDYTKSMRAYHLDDHGPFMKHKEQKDYGQSNIEMVMQQSDIRVRNSSNTFVAGLS